MIEPCGHRVLVKPLQLEEIDKTYASAKRAGIEIMGYQEKAETAIDKGVVVTVGTTAFKDFGNHPWCKMGDTIVYARFAGKKVKDPETDIEYVIINDEDVVAILIGEKTND